MHHLVGPKLPCAPKAALDLVVHKQSTGVVAELAQTLEELHGGDVDASLSLRAPVHNQHHASVG